MDIFTLILWIVTTVWFVISIIKNRKKTFSSIRISTGMMKNIVGDIIATLLAIGLLITVLPPTTLKEFLGNNNSIVSTIIFALVGCISLIPAFVAFPLAGSLMESGAGVMPIVAFITTLTMVGVVTFPLEKREFGTKFTIVRNVFSFVFAIIISLLMGVIL